MEYVKTATDELCRMLDERGVEYNWTDRLSEVPSYQSVSWWFNTADRAEFREYHDGSTQLLIRSSKTNLTPEQAIAATIGHGTCHIKEFASYGYPFECSECKARYGVDVLRGELRFCPNCGRKVVDDG